MLAGPALLVVCASVAYLCLKQWARSEIANVPITLLKEMRSTGHRYLDKLAMQVMLLLSYAPL